MPEIFEVDYHKQFDLFDNLGREPLRKLITLVDKFNIPPINVLQYSLDNMLLRPFPCIYSVNLSYNFFIKNVYKNKDELELFKYYDESSYAPTLIAFSSNIPIQMLLNNSIYFEWSTKFFIINDLMNADLKNEHGILQGLKVVRKEDKKLKVSFTNIDGGPAVAPFVKDFNFYALYDNIPFHYYLHLNENYKPIMDKILNDSYMPDVLLDKEECDVLYKEVTEKGFIMIPDRPNLQWGIRINKDFIKQKPAEMSIFAIRTNIDTTPIQNVCLYQKFNNDTSLLLFYRYIDCFGGT